MFLSKTKGRSPRAQSKGRVELPGRVEQRGQQHTHYKGRSPKAPAQRRMVGVLYSPSSSSKRSLSACACTRPLFITTDTVLSPTTLANLPDVWNRRPGGTSTPCSSHGIEAGA